MYVQNDNTATRSLKCSWMDEPVSFTEDGTARCPRDVGERLVDEFDSIHVHPTKRESSSTE
ncbi:hypothetical protein C5C07_15405 [Haloferax sp. Atlit-4N]|uniref:hypothetical protein n=1 Tax=Haloferax sp. Atlit-4N TaxID=2077206 RepID=UPI000E27EDC6|nr:hypothetical protein [Haloferax sp. Atlit-4N]RDZ53120.1 hypothetical protein C5C07_15405 [Haloferax sp. Atlit-4N]